MGEALIVFISFYSFTGTRILSILTKEALYPWLSIPFLISVLSIPHNQGFVNTKFLLIVSTEK